MKRFGRVIDWALRGWRRDAERAIILLYHRVAEPGSDPQLLSVSPAHFKEQLAYLRTHCTPLHLTDLLESLEKKAVPHRAVVITFDDGYRDNLLNARPILESFDLPATVFVTAGKVGSRAEFWWDGLERNILCPEYLPEVLEINIGGEEYRLDLGPSARKRSKEGWHVLMDGEPSGRERLYLDLVKILRPLPEGEREGILERLRQWSGIRQEGRPEYLPLTGEELRTLAEGDLVHIGSHGLSHTPLSSLTSDALRQEIAESKRMLESILGREVASFSYPYGTEGDYAKVAIRILKESGYRCACANSPGYVSLHPDHFRLPRFLVRNWGGEEFWQHVARFFSW